MERNNVSEARGGGGGLGVSGAVSPEVCREILKHTQMRAERKEREISSEQTQREVNYL